MVKGNNSESPEQPLHYDKGEKQWFWKSWTSSLLQQWKATVKKNTETTLKALRCQESAFLGEISEN